MAGDRQGREPLPVFMTRATDGPKTLYYSRELSLTFTLDLMKPAKSSPVPSALHAAKASMKLIRVPLSSVQPYALQARKAFDQAKIDELCSSIVSYQDSMNTVNNRRDGLFNTPLVLPRSSHYEVFAGERRIRALAQLHEQGLIRRFDDEPEPMVTVEVFEGTELEASTIALVDNLGHLPLNAFEGTYGIVNTLVTHLRVVDNMNLSVDQAVQYIKVMAYLERRKSDGVERVHADRTLVPPEFSQTVRSLLEILGLKVTTFAVNRLPALNMQPDLRDAVLTNRIDYTQARLLKIFSDENTRTQLVSKASGLTLDETRHMVKQERAQTLNSGRSRKPTLIGTARKAVELANVAIAFGDMVGDWMREADNTGDPDAMRRLDNDDMAHREFMAAFVLGVRGFVSEIEHLRNRSGSEAFGVLLDEFKSMINACSEDLRRHGQKQR
jgi:ParB-like nuclease domain